MRLKDLLTDDGAVSPVIGVILMVAITVILAAVIASFVLGLGGSSQQVAPQGTLTFNFENDTTYPGGFDGNLTISHDTGDPIVATELILRGEDFNESTAANNSWAGYNATQGGAPYSASISGTQEGQQAVVAGDQLEIGVNDTYEVRVVWEPEEGDNSATLAVDRGPENS